jgi:hypothetical protein
MGSVHDQGCGCDVGRTFSVKNCNHHLAIFLHASSNSFKLAMQYLLKERQKKSDCPTYAKQKAPDPKSQKQKESDAGYHMRDPIRNSLSF